MGDEHGLTLPDVQEDVQNHHYDALLHCGDLAYDLWKGEGQVGVDWMKSIEGVAAYLPYMVSPGNHEQRYNFSHYKEYFSMPQHQRTQNLFYSYDVGHTHIVSYNTEVFCEFLLLSFPCRLWEGSHMEAPFGAQGRACAFDRLCHPPCPRNPENSPTLG